MSVHPDILRRYERVIKDLGVIDPVCAPVPGTDLPHLLWMLTQLHTMEPADKAWRWLGFIQGCLIMRGHLTVQEERDFTRPYFTAA